MADMKYLPLFYDVLDDYIELDDASFGRVVRAALAYMKQGEEPNGFTLAESFAFKSICKAAKRSADKYEARCEKNRENIRKRWENRIQPNTNVYDGIPTNTNEYETIPTDTKNTKNKEQRIKNKEKTSSNDVCVEPSGEASTPPDTDEVVSALILNDGTMYHLTESMAERYEKLYPAVDIRQEFRNMAGWCIGNPLKRKTKNGVGRFVTNWLSGEQNKYKGSRTPVPDYRPPQNNSSEMFDFLNAVIEGRDNDPSGNSSYTENS